MSPRSPLAKSLGRSSIYFIENRGQVAGPARYYLRGSDRTVFVGGDGLTVVLEPKTKTDRGVSAQPPAAPNAAYALRLEFVGARPDAPVLTEGARGPIVNLLTGGREHWRTGLPSTSRLVYPDLWPGIDLALIGDAQRIKYELRVKPGADPRRIRLRYRGSEGLHLEPSGELTVATPAGTLRDPSPVSYQEANGSRTTVETRYSLAGPRSGTFGFALAQYDRSRRLVIDPAVFVSASYLGGAGEDSASDVAVDSFGAAYITGNTQSSEISFPTGSGFGSIPGAYRTYSGGRDAFVAKVRPSGAGLEYVTYIGGNGDDTGTGIAVDGAGCAYVAGYTNNGAQFPVAGGPSTSYHGGANDVFVLKLNPSGTALLYSGFIGGVGDDREPEIALSSSGSAYVTGFTYSDESTFPTGSGFGALPGADRTYNGNGDGFVAKVRPDGSGLVYASYIGGSGEEIGYDIGLDAAGNVYIGGDTTSHEDTFPNGSGVGSIPSPNPTFGGGARDAYVVKINAAGTAFSYVAFIGGSAEERYVPGLAVSPQGSAWITGRARSAEDTFPTGQGFGSIPGFDRTYNGGEDAFVVKINAAGTAFDYATYLGGSGSEEGQAVAVDSAGNAYVTGQTNSTESTFPDGDGFGSIPGPDTTYNGGPHDAFLVKLDPSGTSVVYATYIGGPEGSGLYDELGTGVAVDAAGNAYVTGYTTSSSGFPGGNGFGSLPGFDQTFNGSMDAFLVKISSSGASTSPTPADSPSALLFNAIPSPQQVGINFPVTLRLVRPDGSLYPYSGEATLGTSAGLRGVLNRSSVQLLNGTATLSLGVSVPSGALQLTARTDGLEGTSQPFAVQGGPPGQTGALHGSVRDEANALLNGATVRVASLGPPQTFTATDGTYSTGPIACNTFYTVTAQHLGAESLPIELYLPCRSDQARDLIIRAACAPDGTTPVLFVPGFAGSATELWTHFSPWLPEESPEPEDPAWEAPLSAEIYHGLVDSSFALSHPLARIGWKPLAELLESRNPSYRPGCRLIPVPWDWRRPIREEVNKYLIPAIDRALAACGPQCAKVHLVTHSTGALLARYYLQGCPEWQWDPAQMRSVRVTTCGGRHDVDKLALVGPANRGVNKVYFASEGGDPLATDAAPGDGSGLYQRLAENTFRVFHHGDDPPQLTGASDFLDRIRYQLAMSQLFSLRVPLAKQLMPTLPFLVHQNGGAAGLPVCGQNQTLETLEEIDASAQSSPLTTATGSSQKVRTMLFAGNAVSTLDQILVRPAVADCLGIHGLYPDGAPFLDLQGNPVSTTYIRSTAGDGTVPLNAAKLAGRDADLNATGNMILYNNVEHTRLVDAAKEDIADFLCDGATPACSAPRAIVPLGAPEPATALSIVVQGRTAPYLVNPQAQASGFDPTTGAYELSIPSSSVDAVTDAASVHIGDPVDGVYHLTLKTSFEEDYTVSASFSSGTVSGEIHAHAMGHASATRALAFTLSSQAAVPLMLADSPLPPANPQADAFMSGGMRTRISWTPSPSQGIAAYRVYARPADGVSFALIGESATTSLDTPDPWASDAAITPRLYAVSAVDGQGAESLLSPVVTNDDRDHDGLADAQETQIGTSPDAFDTDGDGLSDGEETVVGTNPLIADTDGDGNPDSCGLSRALPTATVSGSKIACPDSNSVIRATLTGEPPWTLQWSDGFLQSGIMASPATRSVSPTTDTTYSIPSILDAHCEGTASGSATITIDGTCTMFHTVQPCRVVDTRGPVGDYGGPALAGGTTRIFTLGSQCGIPVTAKAVSLNITALGATRPGHLRLYPGGDPLPTVSTINFIAGQTRANNAVIRLGVGGTLAIFGGLESGGTVEIIVDVNGYFE
jgi:hypothetical protein